MDALTVVLDYKTTRIKKAHGDDKCHNTGLHEIEKECGIARDERQIDIHTEAAVVVTNILSPEA